MMTSDFVKGDRINEIVKSRLHWHVKCDILLLNDVKEYITLMTML